jgi:hypothetical protein
MCFVLKAKYSATASDDWEILSPSHQGDLITEILTDSVFECTLSGDPGVALANQTSLRTPRTCKAGSLRVLLTYPSSFRND